MTENLIVTFYFASGKKLVIPLHPEVLKEIIGLLKSSWERTSIINEEIGINFAQVTHYQVEK